jgi:SAM-dependent methyltransferase
LDWERASSVEGERTMRQDAKRSAPAVARNREPILAVLRDVLPATGTFLEIASGTGEHCVFFAQHLPQLRFLPSDLGDEQLASIEAWRRHARLDHVLPPLRIDVTQEDWFRDAAGAFAQDDELGRGLVDVVFCANMIHIAPPAALTGLVRGAARHLRPGGLLITYGPYKMGGRHTAPSNEEFERWLHSLDPSYGVRDLEELVARGAEVGLHHERTFPMPANNFTIVFRRASAASLEPTSPRAPTRGD